MCSVEGEEDGGEKYEGKNVVDVSVVKGGGGKMGEGKGKERKEFGWSLRFLFTCM